MMNPFKRVVDRWLKNNRVEPQNEKYVVRLMEQSGWSHGKASRTLYHTKQKYGIRYTDFIRYELYKVSKGDYVQALEAGIADHKKQKEQQKEQQKRQKKLKNMLQKNQAADEHVIETLMARTGWDHDFANAKILEAQSRTNCTYKEYLLYKFYELEKEEQEQVFLAYESLQILDKFDVDETFTEILLDKERTNLLFNEYLKRAWCVNTKVSLEEFRTIFQGKDRIIYKPIHGNRGIGIQTYTLTEDTMASVYEELKAMPEAVIEEYVCQHPEMSRMAASSVNTLRIVTISSNENQVTPDGKYLDVAYAALRIGGGKSVVDNFHSGGMVAAVDMETGTLATNATDMENNVFRTHPETGTPIKGFVIPYFQEAVAMVRDACEKKKIQGYTGWDVAITERGPVLIEVNIRPGVVLISTPWATERKGMRSVMKKYLEA